MSVQDVENTKSSVATKEIKNVADYNQWYLTAVQTIQKYQEWYEQDVQDSQADNTETRALQIADVFLGKSGGVLRRFCISVMGSTTSGKCFCANNLLKNKDKENQTFTDDFPVLNATCTDLPVLQNSDEEIPALTEFVTEPTNKLTAKDVTFSFPCDIHSNTITPVMLTYNADMAVGFYFLKNTSFAQEVSLVNLLNSIHDNSLKDSQLWKIQQFANQEELDKLVKFINAREEMSTEDALNAGYAVESLPRQHNQVVVPKWRAVVVNLPCDLLEQHACVMNLPATDSVYQNINDRKDILAASHIRVHVFNCASGVLRSDAQLLRRHVDMNAYQLQKVLLLNSKRVPNFSKQLQESWQVEENNIYIDTLDLSNNMRDILLNSQSLLVNSVVTPSLKKMLVQSKSLSEKIRAYEKELLDKAKVLDSRRRENNQLSDEQSALVMKLTQMNAHFEQSDAEKIYTHIQTIINETNLEKLEKRAGSFIKSSDNSVGASEIDSAKNVLLSGLKLDLKRCQKYMTQLNNSVKGLYEDLRQHYDAEDFIFSKLPDMMVDLEKQNSRDFHGVEDYENHVLLPLKEAYYSDIKSLKQWYEHHVRYLREPVLVLEERKSSIDEEMTAVNQKSHELSISISAVQAKTKHASVRVEELLGMMQTLNFLI